MILLAMQVCWPIGAADAAPASGAGISGGYSLHAGEARVRQADGSGETGPQRSQGAAFAVDYQLVLNDARTFSLSAGLFISREHFLESVDPLTSDVGIVGHTNQFLELRYWVGGWFLGAVAAKINEEISNMEDNKSAMGPYIGASSGYEWESGFFVLGQVGQGEIHHLGKVKARSTLRTARAMAGYRWNVAGASAMANQGPGR